MTVAEVATVDLQLVGLKRTCTNWLGWLVEANFPGTRCWHGPKHEVPPKPQWDRDGYLICTKHPLAWICSMERYLRDWCPSRAELAQQWNEGVAWQIASPPGDSSIVVRYEDLLERQANVLSAIAQRFGLEMPLVWQSQDRAMLRGGDDMRGTDAVSGRLFARRGYYLTGAYLSDFTPSERRMLRDIIDPKLAAALEYEL